MCCCTVQCGKFHRSQWTHEFLGRATGPVFPLVLFLKYSNVTQHNCNTLTRALFCHSTRKIPKYLQWISVKDHENHEQIIPHKSWRNAQIGSRFWFIRRQQVNVLEVGAWTGVGSENVFVFSVLVWDQALYHRFRAFLPLLNTPVISICPNTQQEAQKCPKWYFVWGGMTPMMYGKEGSAWLPFKVFKTKAPHFFTYCKILYYTVSWISVRSHWVSNFVSVSVSDSVHIEWVTLCLCLWVTLFTLSE